MAYTKYSLTPANNTNAPPDGAPEGMLPSAVNDTMRDMMAQIRDCGDGIRGGTYTMTAPVITGGSITGVTFASIVITGGSITGITDLAVADGGTGASTLTGVLKGNGASAFTAATAGTDYVAPATATTFTALQTFNGTSALGALKTININEPATVSATASTGTINFDVTTQSVLYYTTNASGNFTLNFRASSGTSLNTLLATGDSICVSFLCTNGATAYYNSAVQVDGSSVTPKYQGGTAWTSGNASSIDAYNFVIVKTGSAAFTILTSQTKFSQDINASLI